MSSNNPFLNIATEHVLFEKGPIATPQMILWSNRPVFIFGRHQNPWAELDVPKATVINNKPKKKKKKFFFIYIYLFFSLSSPWVSRWFGGILVGALCFRILGT